MTPDGRPKVQFGHLYLHDTTGVTVDIATQNVAVIVGALTAGLTHQVTVTAATGRITTGKGRFKFSCHALIGASSKAGELQLWKNGAVVSGAVAGPITGIAWQHMDRVIDCNDGDYFQLAVANSTDTADLKVYDVSFTAEALAGHPRHR